MSSNTNAALASVETSPPAHLSDADLLTQIRSLVGRSNRILAELLARLGEVEARGIHRTRACSSLYAYCIYELRFSEDEAFRRVTAARLVRRFPALLDALAAGELHLTGLLMLGPHLTADNYLEVMARAKHRTKREIARLVRVLDPLPSVPACIEPLGPEPARLVPSEPTWEQFVGAMNPVRELEAGERPREWGLQVNVQRSDPQVGHQRGDATSSAPRPSLEALVTLAPAGFASMVAAGGGAFEGLDAHAPERVDVTGTAREPAVFDGTPETSAPAQFHGTPTLPDLTDFDGLEMHAPARMGVNACGDLASPQRYKVQFTATEEYVRLVDEAKALLSHAAPRVTLEDVQLCAMRAFVEALRKRKYGTAAPARGTASEIDERDRAPRAQNINRTSVPLAGGVGEAPEHLPSPRSVEEPCAEGPGADAQSRQAGARATANTAKDSPSGPQAFAIPAGDAVLLANEFASPPEPRRRGRYIPAAIRRAVAARDHHCCTYADASGRRCSETRRLEFHHVLPFAVSPIHEISNLTLRCAGHNNLAAEEDFGRDLVHAKRHATRHERFCQEEPLSLRGGPSAERSHRS